jgi:hypothetical protein
MNLLSATDVFLTFAATSVAFLGETVLYLDWNDLTEAQPMRRSSSP